MKQNAKVLIGVVLVVLAIVLLRHYFPVGGPSR
jgi:hypothetical protein